MDAKLVVVSGTTKATEVTLRLPAVVGRGREATLMLPHPLVSRRHCEIFESNGYLVVRDMGSLNGTFVNNKRITEAVLPPGAYLTLGSITFRAVYELNATAADPNAPVPVAAEPPAGGPGRKRPSESATDVQDFDELDLGSGGGLSKGKPSPPSADKPQAKASAEETTPVPPAKPKSAPSEDDDLADFLSDFE